MLARKGVTRGDVYRTEALATLEPLLTPPPAGVTSREYSMAERTLRRDCKLRMADAEILGCCGDDADVLRGATTLGVATGVTTTGCTCRLVVAVETDLESSIKGTGSITGVVSSSERDSATRCGSFFELATTVHARAAAVKYFGCMKEGADAVMVLEL